ncbi:MAG: hypothetical protein ACC608_05070 [Anaerofustis sp.]
MAHTILRSDKSKVDATVCITDGKESVPIPANQSDSAMATISL